VWSKKKNNYINIYIWASSMLSLQYSDCRLSYGSLTPPKSLSLVSFMFLFTVVQRAPYEEKDVELSVVK